MADPKQNVASLSWRQRRVTGSSCTVTTSCFSLANDLGTVNSPTTTWLDSCKTWKYRIQ